VHEEKKQEFHLTLSRKQLQAGEPVLIQAQVLDTKGKSVGDARVDLHVLTPDGRKRQIQSAFSRDKEQFEARYSPEKTGEYVVLGSVTRGGKSVGKAERYFQVVSADRELSDQAADHSLLRRLAAATRASGGQYYPHQKLRSLLERLADAAEPERISEVRRREVWDTPLLFALFGLAIAAEWFLRKLKGLV
jgi:hypothetical protein